MLDNTIIALIISTLVAGETIAGIPGLPIAAAFQPTQQGVNTNPTIFIYKISDHRYGSMLREDIWDQVHSVMDHIESQQYETTFQISALATQNPKTPTQYTASDICNLCAAILQSDVAIQTMQAAGVGVMRVTEVRNPYFQDDRARFEASPSFDIVVTHKQTISSTIPIINAETIEVYEV